MAPHLWGGAVLFAAGLHLCVATPCATTVEFSRGHNPLLNDLTEEGFELVDGHVLAPDRPGLGLTLRRDVVEKITVPLSPEGEGRVRVGAHGRGFGLRPSPSPLPGGEREC